ncbi:methyltransferase [Streptomyces sp. NPDC023838]|uniref:methyltransferase n=1 Tax=Streptomyces sp. NPDC023838 TaxID=3154325 RepID=UPI0033EBD755
MPPIPPARVVRIVEGVRARVQRLAQLMVPAPIAVLELAQGAWVSQAIYVAAELKIADQLADGPLSSEEIARRIEADPDAVHRLLRALASYRIFSEQSDGRFKLTPMADALRTGTPTSMRDMALLTGHPASWEDWGALIHTVRTGQPSLEKNRGMHAYEYLGQNPEFAEIFLNGMGTLSNMETEPILAAYDFSKYKTLVDVFGGRGGLLSAILKKTPESKGILFDSRADELGAHGFLTEEGVVDRVEIDKGDLFGPLPTGADAYLLKHILHEWPEPKALEILKNTREAISPDGRLLVMEFVPPEGNGAHPAKLVDLWLMILVGGKERTARQYSEILRATGFQLDRVVQTAAGVSIVEARPV